MDEQTKEILRKHGVIKEHTEEGENASVREVSIDMDGDQLNQIFEIANNTKTAIGMFQEAYNNSFVGRLRKALEEKARELEEFIKYLDIELENPIYEGKDIDTLFEEAEKDEDGNPVETSLFMKALIAAKAAQDGIVNSANFYHLPTSPASDFILEIFAASNNLENLPDRKKQINHNTTVKVLKNKNSEENRRRITLKNRKSQIAVELSDIEKISNKPAKKIFILALIKANEQAIFDGQLTRDYITFPLKELIDIGLYKTVQSARKGFNTGLDTLTSLKIKGEIRKTKNAGKKKEAAVINALEVLFTGGNVVNNQCTIYFNPRINWGFIVQYFTILPRYYFKLSNRASDLLYYIFFLARQNINKIENDGYFTIGFRAIQQRLQLPSEVNNKDPGRTIKQPIDDAIEEIETEHSRFYGNTEFSLLPVCDDKAPTKDYLDNGYLKVGLSGEFSRTFIDISKTKKKKIEASQKRKERIEEKAIAMKMKEKIEVAETNATK